jgi:hypothetical protein
VATQEIVPKTLRKGGKFQMLMEELQTIEAPLSDDFWVGVGVGLAIGAILFC